MTREEASKIISAKVDCMKRETSGTDLDCNYRNCDECDLCYGQGTTGEQIEALGMAIEALKAQATLDDVSNAYENGYMQGKFEAQQWIPCSERLPEEGNTTYLTTVDYGEFGGGVGQRFFYGKNIGWEDDAVIAWMPLPEQYKGE